MNVVLRAQPAVKVIVSSFADFFFFLFVFFVVLGLVMFGAPPKFSFPQHRPSSASFNTRVFTLA